MYIYAKIGTWPMGKYKALRKRVPPRVGDMLTLRGFDDWEDYRVRVTEIKQIPQRLYCVERM